MCNRERTGLETGAKWRDVRIVGLQRVTLCFWLIDVVVFVCVCAVRDMVTWCPEDFLILSLVMHLFIGLEINIQTNNIYIYIFVNIYLVLVQLLYSSNLSLMISVILVTKVLVKQQLVTPETSQWLKRMKEVPHLRRERRGRGASSCFHSSWRPMRSVTVLRAVGEGPAVLESSLFFPPSLTPRSNC